MNSMTRALVTSIAVAGLALGAVGLAQPRAAGLGGGWPARPTPGMVDRVADQSRTWSVAALPNLAALPIGTTVEIRLHDAEPVADAEARTVVGLTVGVDSELAFASAVEAAVAEAESWEAAYLVVAIGETRQTLALAGAEAAPTSRPAGGALVMRVATAGMQPGNGISVAFYDVDPAQGGAPVDTLRFVLGEDSAIGFRSALAEMAAEAAYVEVVTSPRSWTVDLKAAQARRGEARERLEELRERMGDLARRFPGLAERMRAHPGTMRGDRRQLPDSSGPVPGRR